MKDINKVWLFAILSEVRGLIAYNVYGIYCNWVMFRVVILLLPIFPCRARYEVKEREKRKKE